VGVGLGLATAVLWALSPMVMASVGRRIGSHATNLLRLLIAGGARISPATAGKLSAVANHPATWANAPYRPAGDYRWHADGQTPADKRTARR